ncbi:MAG TPA: LytTR family DNA-binding domain-containing protein [Saprospiraceae bacterium]|nr:LytTR family DNA-binding domain-containing protein [Saprospiraceae bacterium]
MESKYTCLIVDDEYPAHDVIKALIKLNAQLVFVKSCYTGEEALQEITQDTYDLVFLDINMPGLSGIEVLQKLESKPAIIITTAYTDFAFDAYQNDAIDYLQKPIAIDRFEKAISKAIIYAQSKKLENTQFLTIKVDGIKQKINQEDILFCQSMGNFVKYFVNNIPKPLIVNQSLSSQLKELNPNLFIQIHRTCIVNRLFIIRKKDKCLVLKGEVELPIGRKYTSILNSI